MREIDFFAVVIADQRDGVLQHRHHAEAEQIDLDDAQVGAVVLVPLHDDAAGHGGGFERHDGIELSLADHHAAGVLAEMARQILHRFAQLEIFAQARMIQIEAGIVKAVVERVVERRDTPRWRPAAETLSRVSGSKPSALPTSRAAMRPR